MCVQITDYIPLQMFNLAGGVLRILKLIVLMIFLAHWNACFQFLIPVMQDIPIDSWIAINRLQVRLLYICHGCQVIIIVLTSIKIV